MDVLFGPRIRSLRSIILGGSVAAVVSIFFQFRLLGRTTLDIRQIMVGYGFVALCAFIPAIFSFAVTRALIRFLARKVTLGRTLGVVGAELLTIKAIVVIFMAVLAMGCVAILMFGVKHQIPPKDAATLIAGFVVLVMGLDKLVILPSALAVTVIHVVLCILMVIVHLVAKASLMIELLLQGIVRTKRVAFVTSATVIAGLIAIVHIAVAYSHPLTWFGEFWAWQARIDSLVIRETTMVCTRLWLMSIPR